MNLKEKIKECLKPLIEMIAKDIKDVKAEQTTIKSDIEALKVKNAEELAKAIDTINAKLEEIRGKE